MQSTTIKTLLLASTVLVGGVYAAPAVAQDAPEAAADIVVTGSRIRSANLESVSPITQVNSEEFSARGTVRTEDMVNQLPQVFAAQGANNSNEATGTAQVDLRGLTPSRTLVLINGRRLPYGSPKNIPSDVNQVPQALIESVEVLTGGASAVYGSDAIAGVVNFKLRNNFEGVRFSTNVSGFQHSNDRTELRNLLDSFNAQFPGEFENADKNVWNGFAQDYSVVLGGNFAEGRGNVTAYATYRKVNPVLQKDFDYSTCALGATGTDGSEFTCSGSANNAPANLTNAGAGRIPQLPVSFRVSNGQFVDGTARYNYAPFNYYQRPDERYMLGAMAHYEVNEHFTPYVELSFMDDHSVAQIAPGNNSGGIFDNSSGLNSINCDNPFLSAQQADYLCTSTGRTLGSIYDVDGNYVGPESIAEGITMARRNVEGGNRQDDLRHTVYRIVLGTKGKLVGPFNYDIYGLYANVGYRSNFIGDSSRQRTSNAFYAVRDGRPTSSTFGQTICKINADASPDNDDPNCSPLDYFGASASQDAVDYISEFKSITGDTSLVNIVAAVDGDLGEVGLTSPWASTGVGVAFGVEYRKNSVNYQPDEIYQNAGSPELPIKGHTIAKEAFVEVNVPIVEDQPFFDLLSFEGAYRYSDYKGRDSLTGSRAEFKTDTYKLGVNWAPVRDLRFRGSIQRAVRAPNVVELFSNQSMFEVNLTRNADGSFDPCAGATPFATLAQCQRTGVTTGQYGFIVDNPAGQFGAMIGGNPNLKPETANTLSFGTVIQPSFIPRLSISLDYFDIKVKGMVGSVNPTLSLKNCLETGEQYFCDLIVRNPNTGSLWQGDVGHFERFNVNTGSLKTTGLDVNVDYRTDLANLVGSELGSLNFNLVGTYLGKFETTPLPGSPQSDIYDCAGLYGGLCGRPRPEWRHKFTTTWNTPWDLSVGVTWRYTSAVNIASTSSQPALNGSYALVDKELGSRSYFDLTVGYEIRKDFNLRVGVNNIFDRDPPLTTSTAIEDGGNGNTYPQYYDAMGRYFFAGASVNF
ncbi:TonB-dependent receptor domain-containing protein [Sphingomonas flavalba]|uniref:TonB-dependent receptor domain-containing protein n=1 Tax=Sphingomonas flavalba TaxID=2559804 RepID=UPI00109DC3B8|nr:TonB-dependent receptor [Sphingomonas flavalba]